MFIVCIFLFLIEQIYERLLFYYFFLRIDFVISETFSYMLTLLHLTFFDFNAILPFYIAFLLILIFNTVIKAQNVFLNTPLATFH